MEYVMDASEEFGDVIDKCVEAVQAETDVRVQKFRENQTIISNTEISGEDFDLKLKSYGIADSYGSKAITITADFTSYNENFDLGYFNIMDNLAFYQDGVRINSTVTDYNMNLDKSIKAGKTIEIAFSYELDNETSDIEIVATGINGALVDTCSFKIK